MLGNIDRDSTVDYMSEHFSIVAERYGMFILDITVRGAG
jgi:hypothetical protein